MERFRNRREAGMKLAEELRTYRGAPGGLVLALPRGGMILAEEVSRALDLPLDVCLVRKLGVPWRPELAMGALAPGEVVVLHDELLRDLRIPQLEVEREIALERIELDRRERLYRRGRGPLRVKGRTVILVDDGVATGATMEAAIATMRKMSAGRIVVGVGVAPASTVKRLAREADLVISVLEPWEMGAVGEWYEEFPQVEDSEVLALLSAAEMRAKEQETTYESR